MQVTDASAASLRSMRFRPISALLVRPLASKAVASARSRSTFSASARFSVSKNPICSTSARKCEQVRQALLCSHHSPICAGRAQLPPGTSMASQSRIPPDSELDKLFVDLSLNIDKSSSSLFKHGFLLQPKSQIDVATYPFCAVVYVGDIGNPPGGIYITNSVFRLPARRTGHPGRDSEAGIRAGERKTCCAKPLPPPPGLWVLNAAASFADAPTGQSEGQRVAIGRAK